MRLIIAAIILSTGFLGGAAIGAITFGPSDLSAITVSAIVFSIANLVSLELVNYVHRQNTRKLKIKRLPPPKRQESQGTFSDRLESYRINIEQKSVAPLPEKSRMPFWVSRNVKNFEVAPPKDPGWIQQILIRIKKILSGTKSNEA